MIFMLDSIIYGRYTWQITLNNIVKITVVIFNKYGILQPWFIRGFFVSEYTKSTALFVDSIDLCIYYN
ncbi:hypothetical protein [Sedimentibacter sp.]|uniref:hypothetical protein n=1 Tax=Sedimentibacter sp. TaxID=1960295 RepID=UPI002898C111|nr:hypothetical protein [Sedimentibacter sp.]